MHALGDVGRGRALVTLAHGEAEGDIVEHRHVAEERIVLEHEADAALARIDPEHALSFDPDVARIRPFEPGDDAQKRRLARARGPEQSQELAAVDRQADALQGDEAVEVLGYVDGIDAHICAFFHSSRLCAVSVTKARSASSEATAKAAVKLYSL